MIKLDCFTVTTWWSKPTHVLPNSIRDAPATLHSRGNGSVDTTFLSLRAPVWRQGQGRKGKCGEGGRVAWRWGGGGGRLEVYRVWHAWRRDKCRSRCCPGHCGPDPPLPWKKERCPDCKRLGGNVERSWMSTRERWKWISRRGDLHSVVERKPLRCPE